MAKLQQQREQSVKYVEQNNGDLKKEAPKPADKTTEGKKDDTKPAEKPDKKTVKAKKVVVNKKRIVLKKGKKVKLKVKLKPANATEKVTFKSSNKKVAKVTKKYNKANCEALGITVPDDYVAIEE